MKRVSFVLVSLVIIVCCVVCFSAPVSAANNVVSPTDFNFTVDPIGNGEFKVNITNSSNQYWERYLSGEVRYTNTGPTWNDQSSTERLLDNIYYKIYPLGQDNFVDLSSAIDLLPDSVIVNFFHQSTHQTTFNIVLEVGYDYLTSTGIESYTYASVSQPANNYPLLNVLNITERPPLHYDGGFYPLRIWYKISFTNLSSQSEENLYSFRIMSTGNFAFTTDAANGTFFQQVYNQNVTNGKLDDMIGEQEDTNNKLDEIINSSPEPAPPEGSDDVNDVIDTEDELLQDAIGNFEDSESNLDNGESALRSYFPALRVVVRLLNLFLAIDFFKHLTFISLSLGVLVVLLNVGQSLLDRTDASARRSAAEQRRSARKNRSAGSKNRGRRRGG